MKILITGSSGFLGSWLSRVISTSHDVIALVQESSSLTRVQGVKGVEIVQLDASLWADYIGNANVDVLILNDWWGVGNEFRNDFRQFDNVRRLSKLVISARDSGVKSIIGVGSQAELGPIDIPIVDYVIDNPTSFYGEAKVKTREMMQDLLGGTAIRFVWMRIFSTYGPLDEGSWVIPNIVDSLLQSKRIELTKGDQEWSYLHAYDLASAFSMVIDNPEINGIINVGNPQTISIREVALTIGNILGRADLLDFGALDYRPDQVMRLQPMCETLLGKGWIPQIPFKLGIKQTVDWLQRKNLEPILTKNGKIINFELPVRA